jgi:hypothetical protein
MTVCVCVCDSVAGGQPGTQHHFGGCQVAKAVVNALQRQLVGWFFGGLQPQHVLCMVCPVAVGVPGAPALHKGVWRMCVPGCCQCYGFGYDGGQSDAA